MQSHVSPVRPVVTIERDREATAVRQDVSGSHEEHTKEITTRHAFSGFPRIEPILNGSILLMNFI